MNLLLSRVFKSRKTTSGWLTCMILGLFIHTGCQKEEVNVATPKPGPVTIQMRNFNAPLNGETLDGSAPDIYYFRQKEDGSYVFMLSSTNYGNFKTNWQTDYVLVHADKAGVIQKTEVKKLPSNDGITGTFEYVWDAPPSRLFPYRFTPLPLNRATSGPSYVADEHGFLYYQPILGENTCFCKNQFFNLIPETGQTDFISVGTGPGLGQSFRTSDGGFISVGWEGSPDFAKYSKAGTLQFKQPMQYWETRPSYAFLTERDGDFYFIALHNGGYSTYDYPYTNVYDSWTDKMIYENFSDNKAKSFFYLKESNVRGEFEIRFGPGKKQKAHRFDKDNIYKDYVEVPFEMWNIGNNRQSMVAFRDQGGDGTFNLVPFNYDRQVENDQARSSLGSLWSSHDVENDPSLSLETIWPQYMEYAEIPDQSIMNGDFLNDFYVPPSYIWAYLADGATWDATALPSASFSQVAGNYTRPGPQLIKVNANGSSVVKENFELGSGVRAFKSLFKSVPFLDGFAVLINAQQVTNDPSDPHLGSYGYKPTQLLILDASFNQTVIPVEAGPDDYGHQLESNSDQFFYARITSKPNTTGGKNSLLLTTVRNNIPINQNFDFIEFDVEKYRITPTREGGVALIVWVRPTDNTRELLFMEFDENLKLITSHGN